MKYLNRFLYVSLYRADAWFLSGLQTISFSSTARRYSQHRKKKLKHCTASFAQQLAASSVDASTPHMQSQECLDSAVRQVCVQHNTSDGGESFDRCSGKNRDALEFGSNKTGLFLFLLQDVKLSEVERRWSVTENQVDLLSVERVVGALRYGPPGHLLAWESDESLAAAFAAEVIQNKNGFRLELRKKKYQKVKNKGSLRHATATWKHKREPTELRRKSCSNQSS